MNMGLDLLATDKDGHRVAKLQRKTMAHSHPHTRDKKNRIHSQNSEIGCHFGIDSDFRYLLVWMNQLNGKRASQLGWPNLDKRSGQLTDMKEWAESEFSHLVVHESITDCAIHSLRASLTHVTHNFELRFFPIEWEIDAKLPLHCSLLCDSYYWPISFFSLLLSPSRSLPIARVGTAAAKQQQRNRRRQRILLDFIFGSWGFSAFYILLYVFPILEVARHVKGNNYFICWFCVCVCVCVQ